jgi:uncharacterized protein YjiS (DUF1127 family)
MAADLTLGNATATHTGVSVARSQLAFARFVASVHATVDSWRRRAEARRQLAQLSDRILRDVGFDPEMARREAEQPFWKPYSLTPSRDV